MNAKKSNPQKHEEAGVALLVAIFVLLLVSVAAIAMILASGTESALAGNYRSSAGVYYAGVAGLEESRGRLLKGNPDYFNNTIANFIPAPATMAVGQVRYVINALPGETVAPWSTGNAYADTEYPAEYGTPVPATGPAMQQISSVSTVTAGGTTYQGPLFKWARITPATEKSINVDVDHDNLAMDSTTPLYYDPAHQFSGTSKPSLIVSATPPNTARQVFEVTTMAALPNSSQKLMQYVVAPVTYNLSFPSALTLAGKNMSFSGANSAVYLVNGTDGSGNPPAVPGCTPNPSTSLPGIGVTEPLGGSSNLNAVIAGIPRPANYTGAGLPTPSVSNTITLSPALQTPASLNALILAISQNAYVITPPAGGTATQADLPPAMSATNPMTIVVNGNFSLSGNFTGYGLLVVTGNFSYSGTTGWNGIVLVIGSGTTTFSGMGGGNNSFNGAIFVAAIKDTNGVLLSQLGTVTYNISGGGGNGVYYNSCWINSAQPTLTYQVLSFRELGQ